MWQILKQHNNFIDCNLLLVGSVSPHRFIMADFEAIQSLHWFKSVSRKWIVLLHRFKVADFKAIQHTVLFHENLSPLFTLSQIVLLWPRQHSHGLYNTQIQPLLTLSQSLLALSGPILTLVRPLLSLSRPLMSLLWFLLHSHSLYWYSHGLYRYLHNLYLHSPGPYLYSEVWCKYNSRFTAKGFKASLHRFTIKGLKVTQLLQN
jgi:hypothetical protein